MRNTVRVHDGRIYNQWSVILHIVTLANYSLLFSMYMRMRMLKSIDWLTSSQWRVLRMGVICVHMCSLHSRNTKPRLVSVILHTKWKDVISLVYYIARKSICSFPGIAAYETQLAAMLYVTDSFKSSFHIYCANVINVTYSGWLLFLNIAQRNIIIQFAVTQTQLPGIYSFLYQMLLPSLRSFERFNTDGWMLLNDTSAICK